MARMWDEIGDWVLGTVGRVSRIDLGLVTSRAEEQAGQLPWPVMPAAGQVPQIRRAFSVIEGGKRDTPRPTRPWSPGASTRRAG